MGFDLVPRVEFDVTFVETLVLWDHFANLKVPRFHFAVVVGRLVDTGDSVAHIARELLISHGKRHGHIVLYLEPVDVMMAEIGDLAWQRDRVADESGHIDVLSDHVRQVVVRFA